MQFTLQSEKKAHANIIYYDFVFIVFVFIVTNLVLYHHPLRKSNLIHPTLPCCHRRLPTHAFRAKTTETAETPKNPRSFFIYKNTAREYFSIAN